MTKIVVDLNLRNYIEITCTYVTFLLIKATDLHVASSQYNFVFLLNSYSLKLYSYAFLLIKAFVFLLTFYFYFINQFYLVFQPSLNKDSFSLFFDVLQFFFLTYY